MGIVPFIFWNIRDIWMLNTVIIKNIVDNLQIFFRFRFVTEDERPLTQEIRM